MTRGFVFTLLFLLVFSSCTRWAEVEQSNGIHSIKKLTSKLHSEKEIDWNVGKKRGATISKGISFKVDIPRIEEKGRNVLFNKYGIDHWLFKISKVYKGHKSHMGYVSFDLSNMSRTTSDVTIHIFYHAATVSHQFRRFHCPAFGHRLLIEEFEIEADRSGEFDLYTRANKRIKGQITKPAFASIIFSGGRSLRGKYIVELALYNSKEKRTYSPFKKVNGYLSIGNERKISVPSCLGIKEENNPLPGSIIPNIRDLEIK